MKLLNAWFGTQRQNALSFLLPIGLMLAIFINLAS